MERHTSRFRQFLLSSSLKCPAIERRHGKRYRYICWFLISGHSGFPVALASGRSNVTGFGHLIVLVIRPSLYVMYVFEPIGTLSLSFLNSSLKFCFIVERKYYDLHKLSHLIGKECRSPVVVDPTPIPLFMAGIIIKECFIFMFICCREYFHLKGSFFFQRKAGGEGKNKLVAGSRLSIFRHGASSCLLVCEYITIKLCIRIRIWIRIGSGFTVNQKYFWIHKLEIYFVPFCASV